MCMFELCSIREDGEVAPPAQKHNTLDSSPPPTASVNRISLSMLIHLLFCFFLPGFRGNM